MSKKYTAGRVKPSIRKLTVRLKAAGRTFGALPPVCYLNPGNYQGAGRLVRSLAFVGIAAVLLLTTALPLVIEYLTAQRYVLSGGAKQLLEPVQPTLAARFTYDTKDKAHYFNKKGLDAAPAPSSAPTDQAGPNPIAALKQMQAQVGGGAGKKDKSLYSVQLPDDPTKGITYYDNNLSLSFKLTPQGEQYAPKLATGRLIYPAKTGAQAIYTAKSNGLKEDIILSRAQGDKLQYDYKLQLPKELEARLTPGGGLGIYSADPAYFGNISFGSADDQARVMAARNEGKKDHLVFALPAPVIHQTGKLGQGTAKADFSLDGNTLSVKAGNLSGLGYPVSIDPSVVITSSTDFQTGNSEDGAIDYSTAGQIQRKQQTGANLGVSGTGNYAATTSFTTARYGHTSVVYNGYLYVIGGNGGGALADVQYAPINATGTIGAWTATTSLTTARYHHTSVVYNGYLYVIGGSDGTADLADVQYAPINATGTIGAWTATTSFTTARYQHTSVVYNGYIYVIGGYNGTSYLATVQYAPINTTGTIGAWTATTSFTTARYGHTSVVYNGYIYVIGGYSGSVPLADVQYAPINTNGTIGAFTATTSFTTARYSHTSVVYNGYLYVIGGYNGTAALADVQYAPINANGAIGAWTATTSFTTARYGHTSVVYNGYLYVIGGYNGTSYLADVQYAPINATGTIGAWTATTSLTTARYYHTSVVYNGYLYVIGGSGSVLLADVQYAPINTTGTIGAIGAWTATTSFTTARYGHTSVVYNGYIYVIGGIIGTTNLADVQYSPLNVLTRLTRYSKLVDLGTATTISNINYTGTLPGGKSAISYRLADGGGIFGPSFLASGLTGTCTLGGTTRYALVTVAIDDSGSGSPDTDIVPTNVQDITINFSASGGGGVLPAQRLRGGKTITQASGQGVLDILKAYPGGGAICT